jgi:signal transduction histidine kinase
VLRRRVELLARGETTPEACVEVVDDCVREIEEGVARVHRLVRDLGRYTRLPVNDMAECPLDEVVGDALRLWRGAHPGSSVQILERLECTPPLLLDRSKVQQVVLNLLQNAAEAMPQGGAIVVRTEAVPNGARLVVTNEGVGIPIAARDRIFDPLFSTKPEGMGLGLSIVRRIVELHRGRIGVESAPGIGTTFTVFFPG